MPIAIRRKHDAHRAPADDDVTTRLLECHVRVRRFLEEAAALARTEGDDPARGTSAAAVRRYFAEALPLHVEDEDRSIAPLLDARLAPLVRRLAQEHDEIVAALRTLDVDWGRWAAGDAGPASAAHVDLLARLTASLLGHLALEETELFMEIERLSPAHRRRIVLEIAARRAATH